MTQLRQPNLSAVGRLGWCLEYVSRLVFANPAGGTTAWNAWTVTSFPHHDQNFPSGVSFPVWFSGAGGAGHVAVYTPGGIYSSPYNSALGHNVLVSIADVEHKYGVAYAGWSEDILGLKVIEGADMSDIADHDFVADACVGMMNLQPEVNQVFMNNIGLPKSQVLKNILGYTESRNLRLDAEAYRAGQTAAPNATVLKPGIYKVQ